MKSLTLALAATAIAATSSSFVSPAEAGGRGHHRLHFHLQQLHHMQQQRHYYRHDDDDGYVSRRRAKAVAKPVAKPIEKPVAVAKYADGEGRQFDLVSKVWFDGGKQCWMGDKAFVFKTGSWFYGTARWIESGDSWRVASGDAPEAVSCEGIKAFEAKLKTDEPKPVAVKKPEPKAAKVETAEATEKPAKVVAPSTVAKATECKKYFPTVGEMVAVPCE